MKSSRSLLACAAVLAMVPAHAVISVTAAGLSYSQSFDTLSNTGTTNVFANDSTLPGWSIFSTALAAVTNYRAGDGSTNNGAAYSFGSIGSAERALGGVGSSAFSGYFAVALSNDSGSTVTSVTLGFNGEQWRDGGNATPVAQTMVLEYGYGATIAAVPLWTQPGGNFNWSSPVFTTTAGAVNGNTAGLVSGRGGTLSTSWAPGDTLWIRWIDSNDLGNDHGLAIDDVSLSVPSAVPEPGAYALWLAGMATLGFLARRRA